MVVPVGLTVGGWFASAVISKLISELIDYTKDQNKMQGLKDELARLEKALPKIQAVVNGVDQGLIREENPPLQNWLWQLRDATDHADDVMDEIKYNYEKERVEAAKNKVNKAITNFKTFFLHVVDKEEPILKRLKEAVEAINEVVVDVKEFYMLAKDFVKNQNEMVKSAISSRETSSLLNVGTHVFGRKKEREDIIQKLLNPDCKTKGQNFVVLPIIGVGGVGKTTLAQLVYNDPIVQKHFNLRSWVCISNNFDVILLTKRLYESVFGQRADFDSFDLMQKKLKEKLEFMKFLIVFDDVWNDKNKQDWEKLIAPLKNGKNGSIILLTTRMERVARLVGPNITDSIILKGLNNCEMWDLFKECAFGGEDPHYHKELVEIGRNIVKRLEGSPLAAKTMGGILYSDLREIHWKNILESELWSLKQEHNDIMPVLRLTYQYLPPQLKPCFSFCSIFPQDHLFSRNDLINMWIALGMVRQSVNSKMRLEDVGSKYIDEMLSISIFSCPNANDEDEFVMHDLIHDLSILVSQGECLRTTNKLAYVPNTVRHLYVHIDGPCELSISGLTNLRTLILDIDESLHSEQDSLVTKMLDGMESLRLLILYTHNLSEFPKSVTRSLHLRYLRLNISRINAFPKSISRLYFLETLVLIYNDLRTSQLEHVDALGMLINMKHLIAPKWLLKKITGIGRLTSLQELSFSVGKDTGFKICELSNMRELRDLSIEGIKNVANRDEVVQANLKDKVNLKGLTLRWSPGNPKDEECLLDHLQPHSSLKNLKMYYYKGTGSPPIWFKTQVLSNLVHLKIQGCNFVQLTCLEELPLLRYIYFRDMNAIESIIHEYIRDAFPSLEGLHVRRMGAIKEWCLTKQPNKWMHCLKKLDVSDCPELMILPPVPIDVKEVTLKSLGLNALPNLWNDQSIKLERLPALVVLSINNCANLVSLTEGLFQNPEQFVALEDFEILNCEKLVNLPPGGFSKFIFLKKLEISNCLQIDGQLVPECFLPSTLQKLSISSCGQLETILPKALKSVHSLVELELRWCQKLTCLPPKEVFGMWKTLQRLTLEDCRVLTFLESLLGLSCIEYLEVRGCPQLCRPIPSPLPLQKDETERKEEDTTQTSGRSDNFNKQLSACSRRALGIFLSFLSTLFCLVMRFIMPKFKKSVSAQPHPLCSVDKLVIDDPLLLSVEPIRSLSAVRKLTIEDCSELQSLPDLPPFLQRLSIKCGSPELRRRCEKSDQDWPKLAQIPKVYFNDSLLSMNDFVEEDNAEYLLD